MARIAGVNVPTNKRVHIALTYVHGIGLTGSKNICKKVGVTEDRRINNLSEDELTKIRDIIDEDYLVEGDLRRKTSMDIKRYLDLGCLRGLRHRKNLPVRGQRTHTNARTRKGPAKAPTAAPPIVPAPGIALPNAAPRPAPAILLPKLPSN